MKNFTFVILDDDQNNGLKTKAVAESFQNLCYMALATNYDDGLDCILEHNPDIIFLEIDPQDKESNLSLSLINELHRYLPVIPKIIITTKNDSLCLNAFKYGVYDYFINPIEVKELRKSLLRLEKDTSVLSTNSSSNFSNTIVSSTSIPQQVSELILNSNLTNQEDIKTSLPLVDLDVSSQTEQVFTALEPLNQVETEVIEELESDKVSEIKEIETNTATSTNENKEVSFLQTENTIEKPLIVCVKSYGDYRYIEAKDICYLQADNNSTDIHLNSGEMITAFKTLKHFEGVMTYPFVRIHNSYIVNVDFVSRIHTGNTVCHIKNSTTKLPFSKSYKENIDAIIVTIASGNYLEI